MTVAPDIQNLPEGRSLILPSPPIPSATRMIWLPLTPTPTPLLLAVHIGDIQFSFAKSGRGKKHMFSGGKNSCFHHLHVGSAKSWMWGRKQTKKIIDNVLPGKTASSPPLRHRSCSKKAGIGVGAQTGQELLPVWIGEEDEEGAGDSVPH